MIKDPLLTTARFVVEMISVRDAFALAQRERSEGKKVPA
jgi:hypothetical protein